MEELIVELNRVAGAGFYSVALFTSLALPDICAAIESDDGVARGHLYKAWFDKWVAHKYMKMPEGRVNLTGDTCWAYRCGLLHQGTAMHEKLGYSRILFLPPSQLTVHNCRANGAFVIDIPTFVSDISSSVLAWRDSVKGTDNFEKHYPNLMRRHAGGLRPYFEGIDVYS